MTTWSKATLRLSGAALTQDEIDRRFGSAPRVLRHSYLQDQNQWSLDSDSRPSAPSADHIAELTGFIRSQIEAFTDPTRDFEAELYCSATSESGQGSFTIEPTDMAILGRAGVAIHVSVYSSTNADSANAAEQAHNRFVTGAGHTTESKWRETLCQKFDLVGFVSSIADEVAPYRFGIQCQCPLHRGADHSFAVDNRRKRWHCFGTCGKGGDAVTLLALLYQIPEDQALERLAQMLPRHTTE